METLFFIASKTLGMISRVETWALFLMVLALYGLWRGRMRLAGASMTILFVGTLALTIFPLGDLLLGPLESRHPNHPSITQVDGIIVLGGAEETGTSLQWGAPQLNEAGERLVEAAMLAHRFPEARLVFTGGSARVGLAEDTTVPSEMARTIWTGLGIAPDRILLEQNSRNTAENAAMTYAMARPKPGDTWVLVTSAFHMPRAIETFAGQGWDGITAWPVDFRSGNLVGGRGIWRLDRNLQGVNLALKEYLGTLVYRMIGK